VQGVDIEVLRTAMQWQRAGHRVVLGTVVRTWGSSPRPPGSLMAIREDGQVAGSVSGGCIEDDLIGRVLRGELAPERPELVRYGQSADEAHRFGLPCGGTVEVVLEPLDERSRWGEVISAIEGHQLVRRQLDLDSGVVSMSTVRDGDRLLFDGHTLVTTHGPRHRLLIIGGGQVSRYLASMAVMLDYQVTVCEPRTDYHEGWERLDGVTLITDMPDDLVLSMQLDERSAVVALTHDPKLDDLALMEALRTPAFYVGALGSRSNNARRRERLLEFDVSPAQAARLRGPVGLRLGGRTPSEIALSILAEMTAVRCGVALDRPLADWSSSASSCLTASTARQD
jgi:xanthine dehydrogenase accessory factor